MLTFLQIGWVLIREHGRLFNEARGRDKLLQAWRFLMVITPSVGFGFVCIVGISRGLRAGEELLPLMLIIPIMLFGMATVFPILGLMLAGVTTAPMAWLFGARPRKPGEPRTF